MPRLRGRRKLSGLVATVFKGETLRSMLLNAYGWWKVSQITYIAALAAFGSAFLFLAGRKNAPMPPAGCVPNVESADVAMSVER